MDEPIVTTCTTCDGKGGHHYDGQIGSEATPQAFLEALWAVTAECRRVLKPSGSMFVNLGDKMAQGNETGEMELRRQYRDPEAMALTGHGRITGTRELHPLGKLPGSVWTVPTEPLRVPDHLGVDHFAAFPSEWPRRIILGWSPSGVCVACGEGRRPVVARTSRKRRVGEPSRHGTRGVAGSGTGGGLGDDSTTTITGYACACPTTDAPTRPAVILDPFCGTGTVPAVAHALGRHGIGIDLSADYLRLADWRCNDPVLRAKVLRVEKPPAQVEGQASLFGDSA